MPELDVATLRAALDLSPAGTAVVDEDGTWLLANPALCALLGRPEHVLVGSRGEALEGRALEVVRERVGSRTVLRVQEHDARRRQQEAQALVDSTEALAFIKDTRFVYVQVNVAFARLTGRTPQECTGRTDFELFPPDVAATYRRNDEEVVRSGVPHERLVLVEDPVRGDRVFRTSKRPLLDADGRVWGLAGVGTDLTEEVRAREALERLNQELVEARDQALAAARAKSAFLASVSHEVRTPLHGVLGMLEVMIAAGLPGAQEERALVALRAGRSLLALLDDVLDLTRGEVAAPALRPVPVDPVALGQEVVDGVRGSAQLKGLDVALAVAPGVPAAVALDPDRVRQVLLNLAGNAVKFTERGSVRIGVAPDPGRGLLLTVSDTGPGMSQADRTGLFAPFAQGAAGRRHGGTGLGLALSRQLVELMGGTISCDSGPVGSVFTVRLPAPAVEPVAPPLTEPVLDTPRGVRVLLVDDSPVNLLVGQALLEQLDAVVTLVDGGRAAVDAVRDAAFDLVLMDLQMPDLDGIEATRQLRALPHGRTVPVVALTGGGGEDRQACHDAGMDDLLLKPVALERLSALLRSLPAVAAGA